jgi:2,4-dienoyl-CoA reductase (NADPH2)
MHERFKFRSEQELLARGRELGYEIPYSDDISPLLQPLSVNGYTISNRFVVQPMEGYDSEPDGSPSDLTRRRYMRYADGGSATIWFEATAVSPEGRSNPAQLMITGRNIEKYRALIGDIRKAASKNGIDPFLVIQLTHSGRYSKPDGIPAPKVAAFNAVLDKTEPYILSDEELEQIADDYISSALLAARAGFDTVDIKACHGYLMIDSLSAKGRKGSIYGGADPFSRFRFMTGIIDRIKDRIPEVIITTRLNISDCYTGGFGVDDEGKPEFTEPMMLAEELLKRDIRLINISMGSPYHNPQVTRPFDVPLPGKKIPGEHPIEGVMRMIGGTTLFQKRFPEISFAGSAYSWFRHYAPNVGAQVIKNGDAALIGFGRNSFAYPSMPADIMKYGKADPKKFCTACSGCTRLISNLRHGGCVIRDKEIYGRELKKLIADGR